MALSPTSTHSTNSGTNGTADDAAGSAAELADAVFGAFNRRDFDTMLGFLHPEYEAAWPHATLAGLDAVTHEGTILAAFPDLHMEVRHVSVSANGAVVELLVTGRNTGELAMPWGVTFPPSGKDLRLPMAVAMELDGDLIRRERLYFDQRTILEQTGNV